MFANDVNANCAQLNTHLSVAAAASAASGVRRAREQRGQDSMQRCIVRARQMHCGDHCGAGNRSGNAGPLDRETTGELTEALLVHL